MAINDVRNDDMMAHLLGALENGQDIGHYGRLVFVMVGRHFLEEDELVRYLTMDPAFDETKARALVQQVKQRDYNPPRRERILEWQAQQDFPICPGGGDDPDACNVYRNLKFPDGVYEHIQEYHEQRAAS